MTINPSLLVGAAVLQNYLVDDATGEPLVNGTITFYQDNSRTTLKNVYYQTGSPGNYTYTTLPNPLTTSSAGTIVDQNGNDVLPLYYPYSETDNSTPQTYYITCVNENGQSQWTRQNFPPGAIEGVEISATLDNLIENNVFWRNNGTGSGDTIVTSSSPTVVLAPSQHDGFVSNIPSSLGSYPSTPTLCGPDIIYIRNDNTGTETITFGKFTGNAANQRTLTGDPTPEYYININNTSAGAEGYKYISIPIALHVNNLSSFSGASVTIQAINVSGANNSITLSLFQYLGTGVTSPTPTVISTINLSNSWQKYTSTFSFPSSSGLTLGAGGDDGWFLQVGFLAAETINISIALPSVYLSSTVPTNSFQTYEEASVIIDSPRTGDVRISLNNFYPMGWVPMNGGTICNSGSVASPTLIGFARQNSDTWKLFNLLWNSFSSYTLNSNPLVPIYSSSGSTTSYGSSAYADFTALKQLQLTNTMGQVLLGMVPATAFTPSYQSTFTASSSGGLLLTTPSNINFFTGMPVYVFPGSGGTLPTGLSANVIYYVANFSGTTFNLATTFANAISGNTSNYIAYTNSGTPTNQVAAAFAGNYQGEYQHTLVSNANYNYSELPDPISVKTNQIQVASGTAGYAILSSTGYSNATISNQYGNKGHNNTQPGVFMNMYMKL